jgi:cytochrome P450
MLFLKDLPAVPLPGPQPLPLVGRYGNLMRFFSDPPGAMIALERRYGDIVALCRDRPDYVCVFGAEHNRRVLSDGATFPNKASLPFYVPEDAALWRLLNNLMFKNGEEARRRRKLMMPAFQKGSVEVYRDTIVAVAERLMPSLFPAGRTVDLIHAMTELTLCIAMECFFGIDASAEADRFGRDALALLGGVFSPAVMAIPFDLPGTPYARLLRVAERVELRLRLLVRERQGTADRRDVLSLLINARDEDGRRLSEQEIVTEVNLIFIAGHETQATTLTWTLFLLSRHPEVLADLEDEIFAVTHGDAPRPEQLKQMPLLDAVIKESMRVIPAGPFLSPRLVAEDVELGDVCLPRGSVVIVSPLITHRSPELYPQPMRFLPERWACLSPSAYEYLPFGAGGRICVGASFATLALRLLLPMLVTRYRFALRPGARVSRKTRGIAMGLRHGMPMRVDKNRRSRPWSSGAVLGDVHDLVDLH